MTKNPAIPSWVVAPTPEEIVRRFDYHSDKWRETRSEGRFDVQCFNGDPWPADERGDRKNRGRACLTFDELSQYPNQLVNGVRQNKRAPKVTPDGNGSTDQTAEMRAGMIKAIGYKSNADSARITALFNASIRSYGSYKLKRRYISDQSDLQELYLDPMPNPDVLYMDPDTKQADWSDAGDAFELDQISKDEFRRKYRGARFTSFSSELMDLAPKWIRPEQVQLAEYWKAHERKRQRIRFDDDEVGYLDEYGEGAGVTDDNYLEARGIKSRKIQSQRERVDRFIVKYITNGIEILEEHPWTITVTNPQTGKKVTGGKYIPYLFMTGQEIWVDGPQGSARVLQSLIRRARVPYLAYCYGRTAQLEAIQLTSKSPYFAYEGQFEGHEEEAKTLHKVPVAYQYFKGKTEGTGDALLPPPTRPSYIPEIQQLEIFCQACRQAIQAAIGFSNPQVQRNRTAPISGKALDEFEQQGDIKTFHFIDNYDNMLALEGKMIDDLLAVTYDTERQEAIIGNDDKNKVITLNGEPDEKGNRYPTDEGDHHVTISTGPSYDSQREQQGQFADGLAQNPQLVTMAIENPQSTAAKLLALSIKLKDLGPLGDAMAEAIDPSEKQQPDPQQMQQALQQSQKQAQEAIALAGHLQQELKEKTEMRKMELENERVIHADDNRTKIQVAMIAAKRASIDNQLNAELQAVEKKWDMLHESELAPTPDSGPPGIHPVTPPIDPNSPEVLNAQPAAAGAAAQ